MERGGERAGRRTEGARRDVVGALGRSVSFAAGGALGLAALIGLVTGLSDELLTRLHPSEGQKHLFELVAIPAFFGAGAFGFDALIRRVGRARRR